MSSRRSPRFSRACADRSIARLNVSSASAYDQNHVHRSPLRLAAEMKRPIGKYARKFRNAVWEYRLNITSRGVTDDGFPPDGLGHQTLPYRATWAVLRSLDLNESDVFVDIGCGKGRAVCCAARFGIREAIGVEADIGRSEIARKNAQRMRGRKAGITILNMPAQQADFSRGTVFYLFNPFGPATLGQVLERIRASVLANPRPIRIVYACPRQEQVLGDSGWLERYDSWASGKDLALDEPVSFWRSKSGADSAICWAPPRRLKPHLSSDR